MIKKCPPKLVLLGICLFILSACETDDFIENNTTITNTTTPEDVKLYEKWFDSAKLPDIEEVFSEESLISDKQLDAQITIQKSSNSQPVYVHYMPWFQSKETDGYWGQHWTMTNQNPEVVHEDGRRQIASHYYPKIGPYSTKDKDLQQYHLLLMKLSGVDGVIFDWYGMRDVLDFNNIKEGMESFLKQLNKTDIEFAVMYEDRVIHEQARALTPIQISQAKNDLQYIESTYFDMDNYIRIDDKELLMIFGPNYIDEEQDWNEILGSLEEKYNVLTLWGAQDVIGRQNTNGEFAWIDRGHLNTLYGYYNYNVDFNDVIGGVSYPGFHDFYVEGGWKPADSRQWSIDRFDDEPLVNSFVETTKHPVDFVQIATWNDFGEGTMIEPTEEHGYKHVEQLQDLTRIGYSHEDLRIPYYIYKIRKQFPKERYVKFLTKRAYKYAMKGKLSRAKWIISILLMYYGDSYL
ncbi:glycoside hydrolase family 71/99-like protein [Tenacibaculum sp. 190524A05c]|uniref:glycoside hydrolase family 71/99-like protein n=1 Tax=Tenacibaculum platacis TaxID=3137852 RepID=UPI0032B1DAF1